MTIVPIKADSETPASVENASGIYPIEYRVVILLDEAPEKIGSILVPKDVKERNDLAQVQGVLVAVGGLAFSVDGNPWPDQPKVGDRVMIAKYSGVDADGKDGRKYRVAHDKDVCAVIR